MAIAECCLVALDCPDPVELANFYSKITGFEVVIAHNDKDGNPLWVELKDNGKTRIAFQRIKNYVKPTWPEGPVPQQAHLDFDVKVISPIADGAFNYYKYKFDGSFADENNKIINKTLSNPMTIINIIASS